MPRYCSSRLLIIAPSSLHIGSLGLALRLDDGSRMSGDVHVRFCESLGVKFPRATHPRKVFTLQTLPDERDADDTPAVGKVAGFSLHAGVAVKACQRDKLERLCRYVTRPAIAEKRLSLTDHGEVRYELKTPYRDGTIHVTAPAHPCARGISASVHVIAKLAALAAKPRVNLTRLDEGHHHLQEKSPRDSEIRIPHPPAPPQASLFG